MNQWSRTGIWTLMTGLGIATYAWSQTGALNNYPAGPVLQGTSTASNGSMIMASSQLPNAGMQVVVLDTALKTLAVYQIQPDSGVIIPKSVRRIDADFGLEEFNAHDPSPSKVRAIVTGK